MRQKLYFFGVLLIFSIYSNLSFAQEEKVMPVHGISMHGIPKYGADFKHFAYVNPHAPKGGIIRQSALRTFNTFNPYTIKGDAAVGLGFLY